MIYTWINAAPVQNAVPTQRFTTDITNVLFCTDECGAHFRELHQSLEHHECQNKTRGYGIPRISRSANSHCQPQTTNQLKIRSSPWVKDRSPPVTSIEKHHMCQVSLSSATPQLQRRPVTTLPYCYIEWPRRLAFMGSTGFNLSMFHP